MKTPDPIRHRASRRLSRKVGWSIVMRAALAACTACAGRASETSDLVSRAGGEPTAETTSEAGASTEDDGGSVAGRADADTHADASMDAATDAPSIESQSDGFDGASLSAAWSILHPEAVSITTASSALRLTLTSQALWFNASQGVLVSKPITGNFKVTSRVHARATSSPGAPPSGIVQLGGLMARDPARANENYVFIVVGRDENDVSVETKSTSESVSSYDGPAWPSGDAELRICRVGSTFVLAKRPISGGAWAVASTYERPDLGAVLDVGPNIYSGTAPNVTVAFDEVTFAPAQDVASCTQD